MYKIALALLLATYLSGAEQPLPFSHKTHLATGLQCKSCHKNPDPGEMMTFPATSVCMGCHASVKKDSPAIQKLAAAAKANEKIPWVRVYKIPGYVFFSHRFHVDGGVACETCHGPVREREVIVAEVKHDMGSCMSCHTTMKVSNDCTFCHDKRN